MCVCLCEYCALLIYFQIKLFIFSWTQPRKWNAMWCGTHKQKWFVCLLSRTHTLAHHENIRKYHHHHLYVVAHFTEQPIFIMCCAVLCWAVLRCVHMCDNQIGAFYQFVLPLLVLLLLLMCYCIWFHQDAFMCRRCTFSLSRKIKKTCCKHQKSIHSSGQNGSNNILHTASIIAS